MHKSEYCAGEAIEGQVELNLKKPLNCAEMTIRILGQEHVEWEEKRGDNTYFFNSTVNFFVMKHDLRRQFLEMQGFNQYNMPDLSSPKTVIQIPQGQYIVPFRCVLPSNEKKLLPSSSEDVIRHPNFKVGGWTRKNENTIRYSVNCSMLEPYKGTFGGDKMENRSSSPAVFTFHAVQCAFVPKPIQCPQTGMMRQALDKTSQMMQATCSNGDRKIKKFCCFTRGNGKMQLVWFPKHHQTNYTVACMQGDNKIAEKYPHLCVPNRRLVDVMHLRLYMDANKPLKSISISLNRSNRLFAECFRMEERCYSNTVQSVTFRDKKYTDAHAVGPRYMDIDFPLYAQGDFVPDYCGALINIEYDLFVKLDFGCCYNSWSASMPIRVKQVTNASDVAIIPKPKGPSAMCVNQDEAEARTEGMAPINAYAPIMMMHAPMSAEQQKAMGGEAWAPRQMQPACMDAANMDPAGYAGDASHVADQEKHAEIQAQMNQFQNVQYVPVVGCVGYAVAGQPPKAPPAFRAVEPEFRKCVDMNWGATRDISTLICAAAAKQVGAIWGNAKDMNNPNDMAVAPADPQAAPQPQ